MKIKTKVMAVSTSYRWGGSRLVVGCGSGSDEIAFQVKDTAAARRAYAIGREVTVTITPSARVR